MTNFNAINYLAFKISGNIQLGGDKSSVDGKYNLTDGLSEEELKLIDKNRDGSISEEEFKQSFDGEDTDSYKTSWENLQVALSQNVNKQKNNGEMTSTYDKDGFFIGYTKTEKIEGVEITSTYDKKGILTGYTKTETNAEGTTTVTTYTVKNGFEKEIERITTLADGTTETETNEDGIISYDGTTIKTNENNKITKIKTGDEKTEVKFYYNEFGYITGATVIIDKQEFSGNFTDNWQGKIIKESQNGNLIAEYKTDNAGNSFITTYKNGQKYNCIKVNKEGKAEYINIYDSNGNVSERKYCDTGITRVYEFRENGTIKSATDYEKYGKDDQRKISFQEYNNNGQWTKRTFYDEKGENITSIKDFSYEKNTETNTTIKTTTISEATEDGELTVTSIITDTIDKFDNILVRTKEKINENGEEEIETIEYKYKNTAASILESETRNKENTITTIEYENNKKTKETTTTITDGISETKTIEFDYFEPTDIVQYEKITEEDGSIIMREYTIGKEGYKETNITTEIKEYLNKLLTLTDKEKIAAAKQAIQDLQNYAKVDDITISKLRRDVEYAFYNNLLINKENELTEIEKERINHLIKAIEAEKEDKYNISRYHINLANLYKLYGNTEETNKKEKIETKIKSIEHYLEAEIASYNGDFNSAETHINIAKLYEELYQTSDKDKKSTISLAISEYELLLA